MDRDSLYMQRCLDLARLGKGRVSPNPMVGCVIVHNDKIIGEGYHEGYGLPHAEVNAIAQVKDPRLLPQSSLYVNLEPCSHHGKTPPCSDWIISHGIPEVIIGTPDPYPAVNGAGIKRLENAGIKVGVGILAEACQVLNRRFFTFHLEERPYIILKWAQTSDGLIAPEHYRPEDRETYWITGKTANQYVHRWRTEEDAILVGYRTVITDNPRLTAREWPGRDPLRIVLDPDHVLKPGYAVFSDEATTLHYTRNVVSASGRVQTISIQDNDFLAGVFKDLVKREVQSIIIEGGAYTLNDLITKGLWDEARVFTGERRFGRGVAAPVLPLPVTESLTIGMDRLDTWVNPACRFVKRQVSS